MNKRRAANTKILTPPPKKLKPTTVEPELDHGRKTRSCRAKAQELIKKQVSSTSEISDDDGSSDDFEVTTKSKKNGIKSKKPSKSYDSSESSESEDSSGDSEAEESDPPPKKRASKKQSISRKSQSLIKNSKEHLSPSRIISHTGVFIEPVNSFLSSESSSEDEGPPSKKVTNAVIKTEIHASPDSSSNCFDVPSTSKLDEYKTEITADPSFDAIEKEILAGVTRLSDSEDSDREVEKPVVFANVFPILAENKVGHNEESNEEICSEPFVKNNATRKRSTKQKSASNKETPIKNENIIDVSGLDVSQLLALGEGKPTTNGTISSPVKKEMQSKVKNRAEERSKRNLKQKVSEKDDKSKRYSGKKIPHETSERPVKHELKDKKPREIHTDSEDSSEWEEVKHEMEKKVANIPKEGVEITLELPENLRRKKKNKGFDMEAAIKRRLNQAKRENQVFVHKVSLLTWIGHGMYVNKVINSPVLMGLALSLIPSDNCYPSNRVDLSYLEKITKWFRRNIALMKESDPDDKTLLDIMNECFVDNKAYNKRIMVLMYVCMMRSLGVKTRLVYSLQPLPLKPSMHELCNVSSKDVAEPSTSDASKISNAKSKKSQTKVDPTKDSKSEVKKQSVEKSSHKTSPAKSHFIKSKVSRKSEQSSNKKQEAKNSSKKAQPSKDLPSSKNSKEKGSSQKDTRRSSSSSQSPEKKPLTKNKPEESSKRQSLRGRKPSKYKDSSSGESDEDNKSKKKAAPSTKKRGSSTSTSKSPYFPKTASDDSDFEPKVLSIRKTTTSRVIDRRVLSTDEEVKTLPKVTKVKQGVDIWAEVFVSMEEKWICVDVPNNKVHCISDLYSRATSPVTYVVAFGSDHSLRDVSQRYCPQFHSVTRKNRVEAEWWDSVIKPFYGRRTAFDREEEEELNKQLMERPLPTSVGEYKNHPLYVLKRHLLKFEAIYPPEPAPLGFIRGEPVYARDCVFTLRSRETWMKEAKIVKPKQDPYKIVKARPKYDRMSGTMKDALPLEIFGPWQVEDFVPPPVKDGKVPRNEYGNVELFKPTMLPEGAVHLQIPSLNRVARKLQIDCAPAMVGFDYHCGACHPVFDGFVIPAEFKDTILDAWRQEEEEREKRHTEKRLKRVYGNWRRLVKALFIRENLKRKYDFGKEEEEEEDDESSSQASTSTNTKNNNSAKAKGKSKAQTKPQARSQAKSHTKPSAKSKNSHKVKVERSDSDSE